MPETLQVFKTDVEAEKLIPIGTVIVQDNGDLSTTVKDPAFQALLSDLTVTKSMRGEPVEPSDPKYHLAVADSIGRASTWQYSAEPSDQVT